MIVLYPFSFRLKFWLAFQSFDKICSRGDRFQQHFFCLILYFNYILHFHSQLNLKHSNPDLQLKPAPSTMRNIYVFINFKGARTHSLAGALTRAQRIRNFNYIFSSDEGSMYAAFGDVNSGDHRAIKC